MSKNILLSVIAVVILVALFWFFSGYVSPRFDQSLEQELQSTSEQDGNSSVAEPENNTVESNSSADTTTSIDEDLSEIDLGDLDSDFSDIDSDLNSL